jgi:hypothetical protein
MLALVATTPGPTPTDRDVALDGELVTPVVLECPDQHCATCVRAWFGLVSRGGTTTAMVVERPDLTESRLRRALHDWLDDTGAIDLVVQAAEASEYEVDGVPIDDPVMAVDDLIDGHVAEIRAICEAFGEGAVVTRLGQLVSERVVLDAA